MLLHYYNVSAIILQVFLHSAQNLILLHIHYVVILLQHYISIFLKRTFLRCCNVAEILQQYFIIFLQCCCNVIFLCCMGDKCVSESFPLNVTCTYITFAINFVYRLLNFIYTYITFLACVH